MVSNFEFLTSEWPDLFTESRKAEQFTNLDPRSSCFYARRSVELAVKWLYRVDETLVEPYKADLNGLMFEPSFKALTGPISAKMNLIRKVGNTAVHENRAVVPQQALNMVRELWHVMFWLASRYAAGERPTAGVDFDLSLISKPGAKGAAVTPKTVIELQQLATKLAASDEALAVQLEQNAGLQAELETLRAEVAEAKKTNQAEPINHDFDEAATRDTYIDLLLREAGWDLTDANFEIEVSGMANDTGKGFVDYVLWGDDGKPLALIEAKRTSKSAQIGQQQAKLYADCLETMHGQRPIIFYSNGYEHWIWDDNQYPPREVRGFYTKDELELLIQRRTTRKPLADTLISTSIVGRPYQLDSVRRIAEAFERDHERKSLVVMATGAGKTRTVIALADLLMRTNWAKRILFLADRIALVNQAGNAFKQQLPDAPLVNLIKDKTTDGRVYVSTYPTMMGLINEMEDGKRRFGPGYFDLVVIDEAHRSVYQKYRAIFDYFDSCLVGLTATPKDEVDHNTYSLFELEDGVPTAAYNLDQAIAEGHLVPPRPMLVPLKFPSIGIRYDDLSEEEKDRWDEYEWSEDGDEAPDEVSADAVNKWLFNTDTVDKVLETLMAHGRKVAGGDRLGKTIIFAKNRAHAEFIYKRFNAHYPEYKGDFARIITYAEPYAQTLIDKFSETESAPHIAISVDMLDTGIDVPDVVNLVFFKPVRSKTKFWQMVGRGTRLRPDLYGPGHDKEDFLIFDVCNNIEFFSADLETGQGSSIEPIGQRLFKTRVEILGVLDDDDGVRKEFVGWLHTRVSGMNSDNFLVRPHRRLVEKFANGDAWSTVGEVEQSELAEISGLPTAVLDNDEDAKRFDLLVLRTELAALQDEPGFGRMRDQIRHLASALLEQDNIPAVAKHLELIDAVAGEEWWADVTVAMLEQARRKLRSLIRLIEKKKRSVVYTDLVDELGEIADIAMPDIATVMDYERFRAKARHFLREHENHLALQRLRRNEPVTARDLDELERMFVEEGIGKEDEIERAKGESEGLGLFIRSLVGLDRKAAQDAVAEFLGDTAMSSKQIEFVNLIVEQLTLKGAISAASLYEPPFVDFAPSGPDQMFPSGKVDELIIVLDSVRANAVAV